MAIAPDPIVARSPGVAYQDLLDIDTYPDRVPPVLRDVSWEFLGDQDVPVSRYTSREFHEIEKEKVWKRVWQMACRDEDIPDVGDTHVYDICDISVLIVRTASDTIKAYFNACLHRGRQLREHHGYASELRCPFHGYCWNLDGSLRTIPAGWDFPHVSPEDFALPELRVGRWGGFVFVNMDADCEPFEDFIGVLSHHFDKWPLDQRYKAAHVGRIFPTNWKTVQEAFMEAYHVVATHPQLLASIGDANSQYDWWGNVSRAITPNGTPSPHMTYEPTQQQMFDAMVDRRLDQPPFVELGEGVTARSMAGTATREQLRPMIGDAKADALSDAEMADSIYYTLFPNFHPWGSYNRIVYRFRPWGDDPERSLMECMFLAPFDGERPKPAEFRLLGEHDDWTLAPELGLLARVFNQDSFNLPKVQKGMHTLQIRKPGVTLAVYQETKIRHFHNLLSEWIARP